MSLPGLVKTESDNGPIRVSGVSGVSGCKRTADASYECPAAQRARIPRQVISRMMALARSQLRCQLRSPYQDDGVRWMLERELDPYVKGGILADEVGLGKTAQMLATILGNPLPHRTTLIVVPKTILPTWEKAFVGEINQREFDGRFMPLGTELLVLEAKGVKTVDAETLASYSYVLTTYSALASIRDIRLSAFGEVNFGRVVMDEAHILKNEGCKTTSCMTDITQNAGILWFLTATPITRSAHNLIVLLDHLRVVPRPSMHELQSVSKAYMLRRTKEDIAQISRNALPELRMDVISEDFRSEDERVMHEEYWDEAKRRAEMAARYGHAEGNRAHDILEAMTRARQACVNPQLVLNGLKRKEGPTYTGMELWPHSVTKLEILRECYARHPTRNAVKSLVFCHWIGEMDAIENMLREAGESCVRLEGSMATEQRKANEERFNTSPTINTFIIQIDCGGLGLNLQKATRVYINSLHWNPANEMQAIGRAHRFGQVYQVHVTRIIIRNTVEDRILEIQALKEYEMATMLEDNSIQGLLKNPRPISVADILIA